jgi:hypothetical protein
VISVFSDGKHADLWIGSDQDQDPTNVLHHKSEFDLIIRENSTELFLFYITDALSRRQDLFLNVDIPKNIKG